MKRHWVFILVVLVISGCGKKARHANQMTVVTSIYPVYDLIHQMAGETVNLVYMVPATSDPHQYEPVPSQVQLVNQANCFIGVHPEFDGWIQSFLPESAHVHFLMQDEDHPGETGFLPPHGKSEDPHIWLSVREAEKLVKIIAGLLSDYQPDFREVYSQNLSDYQLRLDSLDQDISSCFRSIKHRKFIQWHQAWDRFADDYGLEIIGTVEHGHGQEISMRSFRNLIQEARLQQAVVIVIGLKQESHIAESLAREIDGHLVYLDTMGDPGDPLKDTYIELMKFNAEHLSDALEIL